jgi:hypothetical protein
MSNVDHFELDVLDWVLVDYEAPHTIAAEIGRELQIPVQEAESRVKDTLIRLAERGLVQAYVYQASTHRYESITPGEARLAAEPWFLATEAGETYLDEHAGSL